MKQSRRGAPRAHPLPSPGDTFGALTVIGVAERKLRVYTVLCRCECGTEKAINTRNLRVGYSRSCGCLRKNKTGQRTRTHGGTHSRLYVIWCGMKNRCYGNPGLPYYKNYGGRGIAICPEWRNDFEAFRDWALFHGYEDGRQIDRIDNDGNYEPSNCRWVTIQQNCRNTRQIRLITAFGETKSVTEWSEDARCVVTVSALRHRIKAGNMTVEEAITTRLGYDESAALPRATARQRAPL